MSLGSICGPTLLAILVLGMGTPSMAQRHLMSAAHVELIVRHPCAGNVVGDRGEAVAEVGAGGVGDFVPADDGGGRHLFGVHGQSTFGDGDLLSHGIQSRVGNAERAHCRRRSPVSWAKARSRLCER